MVTTSQCYFGAMEVATGRCYFLCLGCFNRALSLITSAPLLFQDGLVTSRRGGYNKALLLRRRGCYNKALLLLCRGGYNRLLLLSRCGAYTTVLLLRRRGSYDRMVLYRRCVGYKASLLRHYGIVHLFKRIVESIRLGPHPCRLCVLMHASTSPGRWPCFSRVAAQLWRRRGPFQG